MPMHRCLCLFVLSLAFAGNPGVAQEGDRLKSADCRVALDALQAQEAKAMAVPKAGQPGAPDQRNALAQLKTLRLRAGRACLGGANAPLPQRTAQPPISVSPVAGAPPPAPPRLPAGPVVSLPKPAESPIFVTSCDPAGCWASDGSRLQRSGSKLLGPRGLCSVQGTVLHCP